MKFDPANAAALDAPEREQYLPTQTIVALLELSGGETVVDYGAGTGRVSVIVADALPDGRVLAVDESQEMIGHLRNAAASRPAVEPMLITHNTVPAADASADRILAVNLLHEVRGENALAEMHRLLAPDGFLLVIDWERGRRRDAGPPDTLLYTATEAEGELVSAGFRVEALTTPFPFHFTLRGSHPENP
jgi:ubiquinone/menaquinone biosynthesis C-methylase UbiE